MKEKKLSYCEYCKLPKHQCQCTSGEWTADYKSVAGQFTPLGEELQKPCPRCHQSWIRHDCPSEHNELYILTGKEVSGLYHPNEGGTKHCLGKLTENKFVKAYINNLTPFYLLACKLDYSVVEKWQKLQKKSIKRINNLIKKLTPISK